MVRNNRDLEVDNSFLLATEGSSLRRYFKERGELKGQIEFISLQGYIFLIIIHLTQTALKINTFYPRTLTNSLSCHFFPFFVATLKEIS